MIVEYARYAREPTTLMAVGTPDGSSEGRKNLDYIGAAAMGGFVLALASAAGYKKLAPFAAIGTFAITLKYLVR